MHKSIINAKVNISGQATIYNETKCIEYKHDKYSKRILTFKKYIIDLISLPPFHYIN